MICLCYLSRKASLLNFPLFKYQSFSLQLLSRKPYSNLIFSVLTPEIIPTVFPWVSKIGFSFTFHVIFLFLQCKNCFSVLHSYVIKKFRQTASIRKDIVFFCMTFNTIHNIIFQSNKLTQSCQRVQLNFSASVFLSEISVSGSVYTVQSVSVVQYFQCLQYQSIGLPSVFSVDESVCSVFSVSDYRCAQCLQCLQYQ